MSCGERVKSYRNLRKMSQEALAEQTGLLNTTISKIESGTRKVTLEEGIRLAEVFGVSLLELAGVPDLGLQAVEIKIRAHHCAQKMREAVSVLTTAADDLERTLSTH